jgi:hypothetical protein
MVIFEDEQCKPIIRSTSVNLDLMPGNVGANLADARLLALDSVVGADLSRTPPIYRPSSTIPIHL